MSLGQGPAGTVAVDVVGDFDKFEKDLDKSGNKAGDKFGSSFGSGFGKKIAAAGAAYLGAAFGKSVISEASDLNESLNVTGLAFGDSRASADKFGKSAAKNLGLAESEARSLQATLGNIMVGFGATQKEAVDSSAALITRAADIGSAWNAGTDEVTQAITAAMTSSTEPIRKFGVIIDEAQIKQKALDMGLIGVGETLTNNAKRLAVTSLIMDQTNNVAGDFLNTQDGVANSAKQVGAMWKDMQAQLGTGLLPVLSSALGVLKGLGPEGLKMVVIGGAFVVVLTKLVGAAGALSKAFTLLSANPWVIVAAAVIGLGIAIYKNWDKITAKLATAWAWIKSTAASVGDAVAGPVRNIGAVFSATFVQIGNAITGVINIATDAWNQLVLITTTAWAAVSSTIGGAASTVIGFITGIPARITSVFGGLADMISAPFRFAFNAVAKAWNATVGSLAFKIPAWVPGFGGKGFDVPDIPTFATGTVAKSATAGIFGEYPGAATNPEVVSPVDTMRATFLDALATDRSSSSSPATQITIQEMHVRKDSDIESIARELDRRRQRENRAVGRPEFAR